MPISLLLLHVYNRLITCQGCGHESEEVSSPMDLMYRSLISLFTRPNRMRIETDKLEVFTGTTSIYRSNIATDSKYTSYKNGVIHRKRWVYVQKSIHVKDHKLVKHLIGKTFHASPYYTMTIYL